MLHALALMLGVFLLVHPELLIVSAGGRYPRLLCAILGEAVNRPLDPANDTRVHDGADLIGLKSFRLVELVMERLLEKQDRADMLIGQVAPQTVIEKLLDLTGHRVLRHEVLADDIQPMLVLGGESKGVIAFAIQRHGLSPHLVNEIAVFPFTVLVQDMHLALLLVDLDRDEPPIARPIKGQELHNVRGAAEDTLTGSVHGINVIRHLVAVLLPRDERLDLVALSRIAWLDHLRHFADPMALKLAIDVVVVDLLQVVREPVIVMGKETEEGGFARALATGEAEHIIELDAGVMSAGNAAHEEQLGAVIQELRRVIPVVGGHPKETGQELSDPLPPVPFQVIQKLAYRMIAVPVCDDADGAVDVLLTGKAVMILQVEVDVAHVRVVDGRAETPPAEVTNDVRSAGEDVAAERAFKMRIVLQHGHTVALALQDGALLCQNEHIPHVRGRDRHFLRRFGSGSLQFCLQFFVPPL